MRITLIAMSDAAELTHQFGGIWALNRNPMSVSDALAFIATAPVVSDTPEVVEIIRQARLLVAAHSVPSTTEGYGPSDNDDRMFPRPVVDRAAEERLREALNRRR